MIGAARLGVTLRRRPLSRPSFRVIAAAVLVLIYVVLTVGVLVGSDVDGMDTLVFRWAATKPWPGLYGVLSWWVLLGQRAICCAVAAIWFAWVGLRRRDVRPLLAFVVVTLVLNVTIGVVKLAVGRLGPLQLGQNAAKIGASRVFDDGTIFPSGHTANAVVIWGLMALLATRHRRVWATVAAVLAVTVGLSTIYLGTHWVSDVVAGWAAGGLVLLAMPLMTPVVDRLERLVVRVVPARWHRPAPSFRWASNVAIDVVPGNASPVQPAVRRADARLLDARRKTTIGARAAARRLRLGEYAEAPRATASS
jgi:membrane-associated phospholipid phosphatase